MIACTCGRALGEPSPYGGDGERDDTLASLAPSLGWRELGPNSWMCPQCARLEAKVTGRSPAFEVRRFRRAVLEAVAQGDAYALTLHDRMRERGFERDDLPRLWNELAELEDAGFVASRFVAGEGAARLRGRRLFALTIAGARERERLALP